MLWLNIGKIDIFKVSPCRWKLSCKDSFGIQYKLSVPLTSQSQDWDTYVGVKPSRIYQICQLVQRRIWTRLLPFNVCATALGLCGPTQQDASYTITSLPFVHIRYKC